MSIAKGLLIVNSFDHTATYSVMYPMTTVYIQYILNFVLLYCCCTNVQLFQGEAWMACVSLRLMSCSAVGAVGPSGRTMGVMTWWRSAPSYCFFLVI